MEIIWSEHGLVDVFVLQSISSPLHLHFSVIFWSVSSPSWLKWKLAKVNLIRNNNSIHSFGKLRDTRQEMNEYWYFLRVLIFSFMFRKCFLGHKGWQGTRDEMKWPVNVLVNRTSPRSSQWPGDPLPCLLQRIATFCKWGAKDWEIEMSCLPYNRKQE